MGRKAALLTRGRWKWSHKRGKDGLGEAAMGDCYHKDLKKLYYDSSIRQKILKLHRCVTSIFVAVGVDLGFKSTGRLVELSMIFFLVRERSSLGFDEPS